MEFSKNSIGSVKSIKKIAAIVVRGGLLLVVRKRGSAIYITPGGKPEFGEEAVQTLRRELQEEVCMSVQRYTHFGSFSDVAAFEDNTRVDIESYLVDSNSIALPNQEIEEVAWIDDDYKSAGIKLGSVLEKFIIPELRRKGLIRRPNHIDSSTRIVVVCDLDGTLVHNGQIGQAVQKSLCYLTTVNVRLILATSRAFRGVRELTKTYYESADLVCCNGAIVKDSQSGIQVKAIPAETVLSITDYLRSMKADFWVEYGDEFACSNSSMAPWMNYPERINLAPEARINCNGVVKICIFETTKWLSPVQDLVCDSVQIIPHNNGVFDIVASGVTKARSVIELLKNTRNTIIAFGNDLNDQELIGYADRAVLVGDGLPGLDKAGHVRRVAANDYAVAKALVNEVNSILEIPRC